MRIVLLLALALWAGCKSKGAQATDPNEPPPAATGEESIPETLRRMGGFDTLLAAIDAAGLAEALSDSRITLLAPDNHAFEKLPGATLADLMKPEHKELLKKVLLYHCVKGKKKAGWFADRHEDEVETMSGGMLRVTFRYKHVRVNNAKLINIDQKWDRGYIHTLDTVLIPE